MPASTMFLAAWRTAYAPERSTFVGSLPENAPPPWRAMPPYVSTMILRPGGRPVREPDRHRHQVVRLVACVSEHHSLVAGANLVVDVADAVLDLARLVDAHRDVGRLLVDRNDHAAGVAVEPVGLTVVPD